MTPGFWPAFRGPPAPIAVASPLRPDRDSRHGIHLDDQYVMESSVDTQDTDPSGAGPANPEGSFHALASRLANTAQVLTAWAQALGGSPKDDLRRQLEAASGWIGRAVGALTDISGAVEPAKSGQNADAATGGLPCVTSAAGELGLRGRSEMISLVEFVGFLSSLNRDGVLRAILVSSSLWAEDPI